MRDFGSGRAARWGGVTKRRGAGVAVVVVMLAVLNIAVLGSVSAAAGESHVGAMRIETIRAFYAAESGAAVAVRESLAGADMPDVGSFIELNGARVEFIEVPDAGVAGDIVVLGQSGFGKRRVGITLETP